MKFIIDPTIAAAYPDLRIGYVLARGIKNAKDSDEFSSYRQSAEAKFRAAYDQEAVDEHRNIRAWRETYRSFGSNPKNYRPTAEALLRRVARDGPIPTINLAVTGYLLAELTFFLPIGGYDLQHLVGDLRLRYSSGQEEFVPLGGGDPEATYEGEVVYSDYEKVLTRRWNYRDCDAAKITEQSTDIALFCEATHKDIPTSDVVGTTEHIADTLQKFCGGDITTGLISAAQSETDLPVAS